MMPMPTCMAHVAQTGFVGAFGGGILSAIVLQQPQRAGIALFEVIKLESLRQVPWCLMTHLISIAVAHT